ncbi:hypothetical protein [uncultured Pseudoteredinibacter sp.]|uniref:hypothetical protein n=1 Tax=uncultured Pseudoteredinibacter sp. TaxID=1641701 RepID=UPI002614D11B|nr:hypothetical protein [uncultured Pseudoteredinibacter sp.]
MNISRKELLALEELKGLSEADQHSRFEEARYACFSTPGMNSRWLKAQLLLVLLMLVLAVLTLIAFLQLGLRVELFLLITPILLVVQYGLRQYSRRKYISLLRPFLKKGQKLQ